MELVEAARQISVPEPMTFQPPPSISHPDPPPFAGPSPPIMLDRSATAGARKRMFASTLLHPDPLHRFFSVLLLHGGDLIVVRRRGGGEVEVEV